MRARFSAPMLCTLDLRITNSPGVSIAGTVSLFPLPGTKPPRLSPSILPPAFFLRPPAKPNKPGANPLPILIAAIAVRRGSTLSKDSANLINAFAILRAS